MHGGQLRQAVVAHRAVAQLERLVGGLCGLLRIEQNGVRLKRQCPLDAIITIFRDCLGIGEIQQRMLRIFVGAGWDDMKFCDSPKELNCGTRTFFFHAVKSHGLHTAFMGMPIERTQYFERTPVRPV